MRGLPEVRRAALACCAVALSLVAATACGSNGKSPMNTAGAGGGGAAATTQPQGGGGNDMQSPADNGMGGMGNCAAPVKTTISESVMGGKDAYTFKPAKVTVKKGGYLSITNKSDEVHQLVTTTDSGISNDIVDKKETQLLAFPTAGTFKLQSSNAAHRAVLSVTVSDEDSGCTAPNDTINLTEKTGMPDVYSASPKTLTIQGGEMVNVVNKTDEDHSLKCTPDAGIGTVKVFKTESQVLMFAKDGKFTCASVQHPGAKVTITVT
ncbi:MAG TPA: hypothetical protein VJT31_00660 [Rugosimonospora sp.]|nr:hypothetical protein [Rugosimonospora sp.]